MRHYVIGDIHGSYKGLKQCLERSPFVPEKDQLVVLGDVCDRHGDVKKVIDCLMSLPHCVLILGNHDEWTLQWAEKGVAEPDWVVQGGQATIDSYGGGPMPRSHVGWLAAGQLWHLHRDRLYVHASFDPAKTLEDQDPFELLWERHLVVDAFQRAKQGEPLVIAPYKEIYVGHTPTQPYGGSVPVQFGNIWMMDTGAGWAGPLTIMNVRTKQFWQSDPSSELYPA